MFKCFCAACNAGNESRFHAACDACCCDARLSIPRRGLAAPKSDKLLFAVIFNKLTKKRFIIIEAIGAIGPNDDGRC